MAELLAANQITIAKVLDGKKGADGYSPTVTTGTSSDGSTTVTVTNKDGSTTTELVDGTARKDAADAAKVATNFINYDSTNGLVLGNKESGSWVGYRTQIDNDSFNVLDENGDIIASYGSNEVELGKGNPNAIIKMCDGKAYVKNYIVGSQNTSVFCGQDVTVVGEWEGASEAYALFKQGFINIGQASSHIKFSNENGNMNQVEIQGQNITINGELAFGTEADAAVARTNLGLVGVETKTLLWTNASPKSSFSAQTILNNPTGQLSGYKGVEIIYNEDISENDWCGYVKASIDMNTKGVLYGMRGNTTAMRARMVTVSIDGVTFDGCAARGVGYEDWGCVPYKIYGIKEV